MEFVIGAAVFMMGVLVGAGISRANLNHILKSSED